MQLFIKNKYIVDFAATIMFFTRIPIKWSYFSNKSPNLTQAAWAFPLVGLLIGCLSGIVGDFLIAAGLPIFLSTIIAISISILLTGAFHEDGFADTADGFGAGGSPEKINKIIHDSHLGTYGTTSLILGFLIRLGLVSSLAENGYSLVSILCVGFASGKLAILVSSNLIKRSKFAKMGSIVGMISKKNLILASLIWFFPIFVILPFLGILLGTVLMIIVIMILGKMSKKAIGGITGDVLGAIAILTELVFLLGNIIIILN
tara:strand:+ start:429 stop:1208 length:780 start_codon:yes stop_codon:yes gene_type:complete